MNNRPLRFGAFVLDSGRRELIHGDQPVAIERKAFDFLAYLAQHPDRVVSKDELLDRIWRGRVMSDSVIPQAAAKARRALDVHAGWIATVHGVGYRFTAPVEIAHDEPAVRRARSEEGRRSGRWRMALAVAMVATVIATVLIWKLSGLHAPSADPQRVAVLPFANLTNDPELDYFGDGMAEELLHALASLDDLHVASRASSFRFRGDGEAVADAREIGRELNVRYLVDGSVRLADGRFRLSARLTDASTGYQVWSGAFDGPWADILTTQRSLTRAIIEQIRPQMLPRYATGPGTASDPVAYRLYLQGRHLWHRRDPESLNAAMAFFRRAASLQPDFAMAYTGLAECYLTLAVYGDIKPEDAYDATRDLLAKALELAPDQAETRMALGNLHALRTRWEQAEDELRTAVALNPGLAMAHMSLGNVHNEQGRIGEAYHRFRASFALNPLHATIALNLAQASLKLGLMDRSRAYLDRAEELAPGHVFLFGFRTVLYMSAGDRRSMADLLDQWIRERPVLSDTAGPDEVNRRVACAMASAMLDRPQQVLDCAASLLDQPTRETLGAQYLLLALNHLAWGHARLGDVGEGRAYFDQALTSAVELRAVQPASEMLAYEHAIALAGLGRTGDAVRMLEESIRLGRRDLGLMQHDVRLDGLKDEPTFKALMSRLAVEQAVMRAEVLQRYPQPGVEPDRVVAVLLSTASK